MCDCRQHIYVTMGSDIEIFVKCWNIRCVREYIVDLLWRSFELYEPLRLAVAGNSISTVYGLDRRD